ncbi:MAG: four helix bundle protein [Clostridia bacterium]|nr:four helix bundle protein [Clostridia bacterium]
MSESPLKIKSKVFALEVIKSCKELRAAKCEGALINQFLRAGTSVGANVHEAFYAHGKADFIAKLQIALKECSESEYWIELLIESDYCKDKQLLEQCTEIKRILISSINTAKGNNK